MSLFDRSIKIQKRLGFIFWSFYCKTQGSVGKNTTGQVLQATWARSMADCTLRQGSLKGSLKSSKGVVGGFNGQ